MNRLARIIRKVGRIFLYIFLLLLAVVVFLAYYIQFRDTDRALARFFADKRIPAGIGYYSTHNRTLRYLQVGNKEAKATILFVHGAPSSMSYFKNYLSDDSLLCQAYMLAIDRPGYGYSGFGKPEPSIALQSAMIRPLLDSLQKARHPLILVGVSYGTSVACRLAMDYPALVDGLVLIAPSLAPGEERIYSIAYFIEHPWVKWLVPSMFVSANAEKLHHREELERMLPYWEKIRVPVTYMQGENDQLIYTSNAQFAKNRLVHAPCLDITMIPNRGHLIAFSEKDRITRAIREMVKQVQAE
ncbi:MAG: alpha/beta hydrolase [Williamsia sp.]|nr:alpha/beta hydrolase [Williamsia sp.]